MSHLRTIFTFLGHAHRSLWRSSTPEVSGTTTVQVWAWPCMVCSDVATPQAYIRVVENDTHILDQAWHTLTQLQSLTMQCLSSVQRRSALQGIEIPLLHNLRLFEACCILESQAGQRNSFGSIWKEKTFSHPQLCRWQWQVPIFRERLVIASVKGKMGPWPRYFSLSNCAVEKYFQ